MDREQQAARVQRLVDTIAQRTTELLPDERPAYIRDAIAKVREDFRQTYAADERLTASAMELVDAMEEWITARAHTLATDGGTQSAEPDPEAQKGQQ
jgi:hypothetical protein